jgi:hypothetical protein
MCCDNRERSRPAEEESFTATSSPIDPPENTPTNRLVRINTVAVLGNKKETKKREKTGH